MHAKFEVIRNYQGPDEIMQGYVGGNISMEFKRLMKQYTLYNYEEHGALLAGSSCSVLTDSSMYGRLRCSNDDSGRMYKITIVNVSQRDAGLYKIASGKNETGRCFFSIEDSPTCAVHGDNITIGWFYNQQGMKRTLRVIHPNQGVMMFVNHTNYPQIKSNFQHRLLYNGDTLQSFMSFTLLNVRQSDAGLYTIETLHVNTIPGSKELNVEAVACSTGGGIQTTVDDVTINISVAKQEVVQVQPTERQCLPISVVIPVVTVAVMVNIAILTMTGCLIWIHRRSKLETERHQVPADCDTDLYITPIASEGPLLISPNEDVRIYHTNIYQNARVNNSTEIVPMVSSPCMDGYEMIPISSNDDFQTTLHNNDNNAESHESSITLLPIASDYLTVEFVMDITE